MSNRAEGDHRRGEYEREAGVKNDGGLKKNPARVKKWICDEADAASPGDTSDWAEIYNRRCRRWDFHCCW